MATLPSNAVAPLGLGKERSGRDVWYLPLEPRVSVRKRNVMVRTPVAKPGTQGGTVKQRWSSDDYEVSIEGTLIGADGQYPETDVSTLRGLLDHRKELLVVCPLLDVLGIGLLAVEEYELPYTPGQANQEYRIKAYSDADFELIVPA